MIGRCYNYIASSQKTTNCTAVWNSFVQSVNGNPYPPAQSYRTFFNATPIVAPKNKSLFWSGTGQGPTNDLAHRLADEGQNYVTLEDSLPGYMVNGLFWCGDGQSGFNSTCYCNATDGFWAQASGAFAKAVTGSWSLLVHGSVDRPAYRNTSYFALYEFPNISVTAGPVQLMVVRNSTAEEICSSGSLVDLEALLVSKFGRDNVECIDNPLQVEFLVCSDNPQGNISCL